MAYTPALEELIPVRLPHERIRAQVIDVLNRDAIVVNLYTAPQGKNHEYREGDWVKCERRPGAFAGESWEAVGKMPKPPKVDAAPKGKRRERK